MAHEKIVTMFSTVTQAEGAKRNLIKAGFSDDDIDIISGDRLRSEGDDAQHPGLWQRLFGNTVEEDQAEVYEDAIRAGGVVLTLRADEDELPRAMGILDAHEDFSARNAAGLADPNPDDGLTTSSAGSADSVAEGAVLKEQCGLH